MRLEGEEGGKRVGPAPDNNQPLSLLSSTTSSWDYLTVPWVLRCFAGQGSFANIPGEPQTHRLRSVVELVTQPPQETEDSGHRPTDTRVYRHDE
eukprot:gene9413-biopygen47